MVAVLGVGIAAASLGTSALWQRHSETALTELGNQLRTQLLHRVQDNLAAHLAAPIQANHVMETALEHGLDPSDPVRTADQMLDVLDTLHVDYVQVGFAEGGFVGAERLPSGEPRLAFTEGRQAGTLTSYALTPEGGLGAVDNAVPYDARVRPWFRAAADSRAVAWSPIYLIANPPPRLGITLAEPVYGDSGELAYVVATDLIVSSFSKFLGELDLGVDGRIAVIDSDGFLVANSTGEPLLALDGDQARRVKGADSRDPILAAVSEHLVRSGRLGSLTEDWLFDLDVDGERQLVEVSPVANRKLPWVAVVTVPEAAVLGAVHRSARDTLGLSALGVFLAFVLGALVNRRITRPLDRVTEDLQKVARFELEPAPPSGTPFAEVAAIEDATERMKRGLRSFERYVSSDLVRSLIRHNREASLGVEPVAVTVFFSDIEGFTTLAEQLDPDVLVDIVGAYLGEWSNLILFSGGTVDKFIGDAIMAFWNAPEEVEDHPSVACEVALACQERLAALNREWEARGLPRIHSRIGLHTDTALVGNLGSMQRMDYTVVGDGVNLASRIEGLNKNYGTSILISEELRAAVGERFVVRPVDRVRVKGRQEETTVYELVARAETASEAQRALARAAEAAFAAFLDGRYAEARAGFEKLSADGDQASGVLATRCAVALSRG